jgi:nucleoside-diphosphate-sugar epimerase
VTALLVLGMGFTTSRFVELYGAEFDRVAVTVRSPEKAETLRARRLAAYPLTPGVPLLPDLVAFARAATHVLVSIPSGEAGDPGFLALGEIFADSAALRWVGYLSTTGVYGDHVGNWIDESALLAPRSARAHRRAEAEEAWLGLALPDRAVQVFRLSGIYGPGRNALADLRAGEARRLTKPGQVFNRIHVDDIAAVLAAAIRHPNAGPVFNLADDEPAPSHEVVAFAADLLGVEPPPLTPVDEAVMSEMAKSFWAENKRIRNNRVKTELGVELAYPTYREGLTALHEAGEGH